MKRTYPDVSELLALKKARRKRLAALPVEEKMEIADRLRRLGEEMRHVADTGRKPLRSTQAGRATPKVKAGKRSRRSSA